MAAFSAGVVLYSYGSGSVALNQGDPEPSPTAQAAAEICTDSKLVNQIWVDSTPQSAWEPYQMYLFSQKGQRLGIHVSAESAFKQTVEIFEFKNNEPQELRFHFPHDGQKSSSGYAIEELKTPEGMFTTKLTIYADPKNSGKEKVYYTGPKLSVPGSSAAQASLPDAMDSNVKMLRSKWEELR